jgi:hypothetical protein
MWFVVFWDSEFHILEDSRREVGGDQKCWLERLERIRFLDFTHRPVFSHKHNVSATGSVSVFR